MWLSFLIAVSVFICEIRPNEGLGFRDQQKNHVAKTLSNGDMSSLAQRSNMTHFQDTLDGILIPRVVGTPNHKIVQDRIKNAMKSLKWQVTSDRFRTDTPLFGTLQFENIIATLNPKAKRYLVLACHYDSKYFREDDFIGATDSAVPCAMMINLAYTMSDLLDTIRNENTLSLKFIFFDGEEAFQHWSNTDSIYGARHLAAKWERTPFPKNNRDGTNLLHSIDVLVLLDLLGAPDPAFYSYFSDTNRWHALMIKAEKTLSDLGHLQRYSTGKPEQMYFRAQSRGGGIEDDHIPFLLRGVPILHVIPHPFPEVWHTPRDNRDAVDLTTVDNLMKILRVFVASYLGLNM
ncbi:Glutaminyl-peptide cyclotransferase [Gryllus bimaculatus]|nr:Glutaminyl-peptide cyclotransferase [Gryllus bimaculatus]